jgi:predicted site-specific integrase-resolvase
MRTEEQIKRKLNELVMQKKALEAGMDAAGQKEGLQSQIDRLEQSILLLEWVLNAPVGSYHA